MTYKSGENVPKTCKYIETDASGNEISNTVIDAKQGDTFPPTSGPNNSWKEV